MDIARAKLTVLIPCKDEGRNIQSCIESVRGLADEILVADSGSKDATLDIVRRLGGCRVIEREYVNSADFKNWAIPQASHPWVLVVDADERVTPALAREIAALLAGTPACDGYRIGREAYFFGHPIRYGNCQSEAPLRLFRQGCRYQKRRVHADVELSRGKAGRLKAKLLHYTCWTIDEFLATQNRYATWAVADLREKGRHATVLGTMFHAWFRFLHAYVFRLGFLDGWAGLQVNVLQACYICLKEAKLWELDHALAQPNPEADGAPLALQLFDPTVQEAATSDVAWSERRSAA